MGWLSAFRARRKNQFGIHLRERGDGAAAERAYREAIRLAPEWEAPWFNLGLVHKERRNWAEAMQCNLKALDLVPDNPPAYWNLGIAASALERWDLARMAWQRYGVTVPDGDGPIDGDFGLAPIRVDPENRPEVVWCRRLDPARAVIESVPSPDCGRRWHDLVLNDGEPRGYRKWNGQDRAVFNELQLLKPSTARTFVVEVTAPAPTDSNALEQVFLDAGWAAEDWTTNFRILCAACSEGRPDDHAHDESADVPWRPGRRFGIAAGDADVVHRLVEGWAASSTGRGVDKVERVL